MKMKTLNKLILACCIISIAFLSCKKDSDETNYGALSGNTLKGKISGWTLGSNKILRAVATPSFTTVGSANISSDGSFSVLLENQFSGDMNAITDYFDPQLNYSDATSTCSELYFYVADSLGSFYGYVERTSTIPEYQKGYAMVDYLYVTKNTTVKGNLSYTDTGETDQGVFDLNLKAGWNTIATQVTNVTTTSSMLTLDYEVNSTEPSTVIWKFSNK
jgi:hypothetical protein